MGSKFTKQVPEKVKERTMSVGRRTSIRLDYDDDRSSSLEEGAEEAEEKVEEQEEVGAEFTEDSGDGKALDLVFVCDCTSSMGSYLVSAQQSMIQIITEITASEKVNVRFALVEYRDHPPQDNSFAKRVSPFTSSVGKMKKNVDRMKASGGGDGPESVVDGLHAALCLPYRKRAVKIVVIIADAPPHGLEQSDGFPNGCPCGHDPLRVAKQMEDAGIVIYSVLCEPAIGHYKYARDFFMAIAKRSGGQYLPLTSAKLLPKVIIASALEELSLQEVEKIFQKEADELKKNGQLTEEALEKRMKEKAADITTKTNKVVLTSIYTRQYSFTNVSKMERTTSLTSIRDQLHEHSEKVYDEEKMKNQNIEIECSRMGESEAQVSRMAKRAFKKA